jgi:hypothetical protein
VLLGQYLADRAAWPPFLRHASIPAGPFAEIPTDFSGVPSFAPFAFVDLSNVPDWMDDAACDALIARLGAEMRPGAAVLWRQLNDPRPLARRFAPAFRCDPALDERLARAERSLFYDEVHLARRT